MKLFIDSGNIADIQKPWPARIPSPVPGSTLRHGVRHTLPVDKVRHVGEVVATVVAESRALAEDAAELVEVDYEPLDPVVDPRGAPREADHEATARVGSEPGLDRGHGAEGLQNLAGLSRPRPTPAHLGQGSIGENRSGQHRLLRRGIRIGQQHLGARPGRHRQPGADRHRIAKSGRRFQRCHADPRCALAAACPA